METFSSLLSKCLPNQFRQWSHPRHTGECGLRDYSICECAKRRNAGVETLEEAGTITDGVSGQYRPDDLRCQKEPDLSCEICGGTGEVPGVKEHQIGLEKTPQEFIQKLVDIFREVRRVLRADGVLWLNMGDSYSNDTKWGGQSGGKNYTSEAGGYQGQRVKRRDTDCDPKRGRMAIGEPISSNHSGLKPKDLVGMPWRLAFALQADGWYLRSDCIWHKPNPMPESVTDRPTKSHEYVFLLSKSERYFYDAEAVKEDITDSSVKRISQANFDNQTGGEKDYGLTGINPNRSARKSLENFAKKARRAGQHSRIGQSQDPRHMESEARNGKKESPIGTGEQIVTKRNLRSVWTIATQSYAEAHFATFPEELATRCVLSGTSEHGACDKCGAPWARITGQSCECGAMVPTQAKSCPSCGRVNDWKEGRFEVDSVEGKSFVATDYSTPGRGTPRKTGSMGTSQTEVFGWEPGCDCHCELVKPCVVLDPFCGSGTTGEVALRYHRDFIGIELNPSYLDMARRRIVDDAPLFNVEAK
jgi:DNA modification methylase